MNTREALYEIGVRDDTLTAAEKSFLDENGYLVLHNVVSPAQLEQLRGRVDELGRIEGAEAGKEVHQEAGTDRLADLVNKGEAFTVCYTHPRVLAAIHHVLRDEMKLSSLNSRSALPGEGLQELHADWESPVKPGEFLVCNSIWLLDDFTHDNGATRVVPGSHVSGKLPRDEMSDPAAPHPREVQIIAPAGSVGVFNAHTWHGGTKNLTQARRRACHAYFSRRDQPPQTDQRKHIRRETYDRLTPAVRFLLDVQDAF